MKLQYGMRDERYTPNGVEFRELSPLDDDQRRPGSEDVAPGNPKPQAPTKRAPLKRRGRIRAADAGSNLVATQPCRPNKPGEMNINPSQCNADGSWKGKPMKYGEMA